MEIEVGKKYRSRDGEIVEITRYLGREYAFSMAGTLKGEEERWRRDGKLLGGADISAFDLIEEIEEPELTVELTGHAKDMASTQNSENELKENPMSIKYDMPDNRDGNRDELKSQEYHVGESNYSSKKIQPWDIWDEYNLDPWRADIVKRVLRTKAGQGDLDLKKIMHIAQHLLEKDYNIKTSIKEEN